MWILPSFKNSWGYFTIAWMPGVIIFGGEDESSGFESTTSSFAMNTYLGYGYTFGRINVHGALKYDFIYDQKVNFNAIGFSVGVSYIFF